MVCSCPEHRLSCALSIRSRFPGRDERPPVLLEPQTISCSIGFFAKFDPQNFFAIVLLFVALINGFCMIQLAAYSLFVSHSTDPGNILLGAQSIFINVGAISLMIFGLVKKTGRFSTRPLV